MLTEMFLNSCFSVLLNKSHANTRTLIMYRDIYSILEFYEKKKNIEIPVGIKLKFDCLKKICELKLENEKTDENIIDSIFFGEKFKTIHNFIESKINDPVEESSKDDNINQVSIRKKINSIFSNYDSLSSILDKLKDGTFDSIDDVVEEYEGTIKTLFNNMMNENKGRLLSKSSSLDLVSDDYTNIIGLIKNKYDRINIVPTGFSILDNEIFYGGFEPTRIYIIGGASGSGKSTLMENMLMNAATRPSYSFNNVEKSSASKKEGIENVYIYITLENSLEESLLRSYQSAFSKTTREVLIDIKNGVDIRHRLAQEFKKNNSTVIMKYFQSKSISCVDIRQIINEIKNEYGNIIRALYIDYLDLIKSENKYDMYRIELGDITLDLKSIAIEEEIPVIVPTQLNKGGYNVKGAYELNLSQISESMQKVNHSDFIMLLSKDVNDESKVFAQIGKNRGGKSNFNFDFKVNFNYFKFVVANRLSNDKKNDASTIDLKELSSFAI